MPLPDNIVQVRVGDVDLVDSNGELLTGKTLKVTPTEIRLADGTANAIIYSVDATAAVDGAGAAWVTVPATDNSDIDTTFNLKVQEPDSRVPGYYIQAPSTAPVETIDGIALPTIHLSTAVKAPAPVPGILQIQQGPSGLGPIVLHRAPTSADGVDGQAYIDTLNAKLYGPKTAGAWGTGTNIGTGSGTGTVTQVAGQNPDGSGHVALTAANVGAIATSQLAVAGGVATLDLSGNVVQPGSGGGGGSGTVTSVDGVSPDMTGNVPLDVSDIPGAVDTADSRLSDARRMLPATYAARPVNVRDTGNPLADAIMDGATHPLSGRFGSLAAAQAVFPGAVALTEEIDYWAIQTLLSNPDNAKVYLSWGTAVLHQALLLLAGGNQEVAGEGTNITSLFLRNGANTNVISPADTTNPNPNVTLRDFSVNGNSPNNTAAIGQTDGILLSRCDNLRLYNLEVHHVNGRGIHHHGLTGSVVENQFWEKIYAYNCQHWGIWNTNGVRIVDYKSIFCVNNGLRTDIGLSGTGNAADSFTGGFLLDHSEVTATGIHCIGNGQDGLWIRNVFAANINEVIANRNGRHGVRVLGLVDSEADSWLIQSNGQDATLTSHNIFMDGTGTLNYGVTARTKMTNIEAGPNQASTIATQGAWDPDGTDYAVWFDDNTTNGDLDAAFKVYAGSAGTIRYPSAGLGSLRINDGSGLERVELFAASGAAIQLGAINTGAMKRIGLTANCDITLPPAVAGQAITCNLIQPASGGPFTWTFHPSDGVSGHMKYAGGTTPTPTTAAGSADRIVWICDDGVHQVGFVQGQNI